MRGAYRVLTDRLRKLTKPTFCLAIGLMLCLLASGGSIPIAAAETAKLEIQANVGLGTTSVKQGKWFEAVFTLTNSGNDTAGDLVVMLANPEGNKDYSYVKHVELPKGSTKVVKMLLPGGGYTKENNRLVFFEGSVEKGKSIELLGINYLETMNVPPEANQIGVVSRDSDTLNFLALLNQQNQDYRVLHLSGNNIPEEALALDGLDMLVLNDVAADGWKAEQVQAIQTWVRQGGTLMLAGGAGYPKTAATFKELAPVVYESAMSISAMPALADAGEKELSLAEPFTLSSARPVEGAQVFLAEGKTPLFVHHSVGLGEVWYGAYDLSLNPLASWNGNTKLWEKLLKKQLSSSYAGNLGKLRYGPEPYWEMSRALEFFPALQPPKLGILAWTMLFYAVVAGPFLYFILRHIDRREWAWLIIPALAVLTSFGIFQFGASNRGEMLTQALNTIHLDGSGKGSRQSAVSLFIPKGGNVSLQLPRNTTVQPFMRPELMQGAQLSGSNDTVIRRDAEGSRVLLRNIPYSSVSKLYMRDEEILDTGSLEVAYSLKGAASGVKGEVKNQTTQDLTDVALILNQQYFPVGSIKKGEQLSFDSVSTGFASDPYQIADLAFPNALGSSTGDIKLHDRSMLITYLQTEMSKKGMIGPLIIGWSMEQKPLMEVIERNPKSEQLTLWVQELPLNFVSGDRILIPANSLIPTIVENTLTISTFEFRNGPFIQMGQGDITFEFNLPEVAGAVYRKLEIRSEANSDVAAQLWNGQKQQWEPLILGQFIDMGESELTPYLLDGSIIRMKAATVQSHTMFRMPTVSLEGVVKR